MKDLNSAVKRLLKLHGASLVGFADLTELPAQVRQFYPYGISIALALDPAKVMDIGNGPAHEYYQEYRRVNAKLDELGALIEDYLKKAGYSALARTSAVVKVDPATKRSDLPHKTLATRSGLGWIGKNALCITPQFGAAQRFTSVLTDAPLICGQPLDKSGCGKCIDCQTICPATAIKGRNWHKGTERDRLIDALACYGYIQNYGRAIGRTEVTCGQCIKACPLTLAYLQSRLSESRQPLPV
jgi:epoxyqueuosine reductase